MLASCYGRISSPAIDRSTRRERHSRHSGGDAGHRDGDQNASARHLKVPDLTTTVSR